MVRERSKNTDVYSAVASRIILGILITLLLGIFLFWRIDSPRVEQIRMNIIDKVIPNFSWAGIPLTKAFDLLLAAKSYEQIFEQNRVEICFVRRFLRYMSRRAGLAEPVWLTW